MASTKDKPSSAVEELARMFNRTLTNVMPTNIEQNVTLWDNYARDWSVEKEYVKQMLKDTKQEGESEVILGEEWSDADSFNQVLVRE